jgi:hypothetical protein
MGRLIFMSWLATGLLVVALIASGSGAAWIVAGTLLCGWGWGVATNYRGVADALPTRFGIGGFWQETSRAMIRLTFAVFALIGALFVLAGAARSA